jgi:predicted DNA-binding transcriptional regulator AlpA
MATDPRGRQRVNDFDPLVPDPQVWRELGITSMTGWRWSHDDTLNFPPPIQIRGRNYRSRRQLEDFKARLLRKAIATRSGEAVCR